MVAALDDDAHVEAQRARYRARRERLAAAVRAAGARIDHSEAGLYLWVTRDEDCWTTIGWLGESGIVGAPGHLLRGARRPARAHGAHRHRRADRRRRRAAQLLIGPPQLQARPAGPTRES